MKGQFKSEIDITESPRQYLKYYFSLAKIIPTFCYTLGANFSTNIKQSQKIF